jgi:cell division protein FtsB
MDPLALLTSLTAPEVALLTGVAGVAVSFYVARTTARKTRLDVWQASFAALESANRQLRERIEELEGQVKALTEELGFYKREQERRPVPLRRKS